jgi:hypothetical protein
MSSARADDEEGHRPPTAALSAPGGLIAAARSRLLIAVDMTSAISSGEVGRGGHRAGGLIAASSSRLMIVVDMMAVDGSGEVVLGRS